MKLKSYQLIIAFLIVLLGVFAFGYIKGHSRGKSQSKTLLGLKNDSLIKYQIRVDSLILSVAQKQQELMTEKEARKKDVLEKETLRKLNIKQANELTKLNLRIDTLLEDIQHSGQIVYISTPDTSARKPCIVLPFEFKKTDRWLSLRGKFDEKGKMSEELSMIADVNVVTGIDKEKKPTCTVTTSNPYIQTINVTSYKFDTPKEKKYNLSIFAGYAVCKQGLSPAVGIGVGRTIIRF